MYRYHSKKNFWRGILFKFDRKDPEIDLTPYRKILSQKKLHLGGTNLSGKEGRVEVFTGVTKLQIKFPK